MYGRAHAGIPARAGLGVQPRASAGPRCSYYISSTLSALLRRCCIWVTAAPPSRDGRPTARQAIMIKEAQMSTRELRFAFDEKGIKTFAPSLVGQVMTYWEDDRRLVRGRVTAAEVKRDRYGNRYVEVELEPVGAPA